MSDEFELDLPLPDEAQPTQETVAEETSDISPAEEKARAKGWKPLEEWDGDPDDWVSAKEFNRAGELMERISSQSKLLKKQQEEMETFKQVVKELSEHNRRIAQRDIEQVSKDLKAQKREAMELGDYDAVEEIDEKLSDLREKTKVLKEEPVKQVSGPPPELKRAAEEFTARNAWYSENTVMRGAADELYRSYATEHGVDDPQALFEYVEREIKKEFPHKFNTQARQRSAVDATSSAPRASVRGKKVYSAKDLSPSQLEIAKRFEQTGVLTVKEYAQQLGEAGALDN